MSEKIGVIGLGKMGLPMARLLVEKGHHVTGYDLSPERAVLAEAAGITVLGDPGAVAAVAELVIIVVGFDDEVRAVLRGPQGVFARIARGGTIAVSSTVLPETMREIETLATETGKDLTVLDIPTCRSERAAETGDLLVLGGGDPAAFQRWNAAFSAFASDIEVLGAVGAGQVGKMINNLLLWSCIAANYEGLKLGEALGVDPELLRHALLKSSGRNWALETWDLPRPMPWAEKDMTIVARESDGARLSLPLCGVVKEVIKAIKIERGLPTPGVAPAEKP